jgi:uncharacterized circularly permuted ATP-grasp superfamily protein
MEPDPPGPTAFDEDRDADGLLRPGYALMLTALEGVALDELTAAVALRLAQDGAMFGPQPFVVDPVPRLISGEEWAHVERGLIQRTHALNRFLHDAYGERRIVAAGVVAADTIEGAEGYEPDLVGRLPAGAPPAPIIGFDLVRGPDGRFVVLEDNMRTPSGIAYMVAARTALIAALPENLPRPRPVAPVIYELLRAALRAAAPAGAAPDPEIVLVTDGPDNVAYYEHCRIAQSVGAELATPDQLQADGEQLHVRLAGGELRRVDVVYRRTNEDRIRDEHGAMTAIADLLLPAWLGGGIGLVNAFGNGVADDKLVHSHAEDFVRFYLEQEPLLRSVPTRALDSPQAAQDAIERLTEVVIKPRHGHGGTGVTIGSQASATDLAGVRSELVRHPERYIAQPIVPLSRHPTVIDGRLEPRHVDLRPFEFIAQEVALAPGGLSRVAFDAGEMVVNSSRNGGGKDTWVLD